MTTCQGRHQGRTPRTVIYGLMIALACVLAAFSFPVLAAQELSRVGPASTVKDVKRNVVEAIDAVAARLGNTRAVCRRCYIHPILLEVYGEGTLKGPEGKVEVTRAVVEVEYTLPPHEVWVVELLQTRVAAAAGKPSLEEQLLKSVKVTKVAEDGSARRGAARTRAARKAAARKGAPRRASGGRRPQGGKPRGARASLRS